MNKQENFVYDSIYHGALKAGANERAAKDHAVMGVEDWNKNRFNPAGTKKVNCTAVDLVEQRIQMAKKAKG